MRTVLIIIPIELPLKQDNFELLLNKSFHLFTKKIVLKFIFVIL